MASVSEASAAASAVVAAAQSSVSVQIASDLHLEFFSKLDETEYEVKFSELITPSAPILALLGDISALGTPDKTTGQGNLNTHFDHP